MFESHQDNIFQTLRPLKRSDVRSFNSRGLESVEVRTRCPEYKEKKNLKGALDAISMNYVRVTRGPICLN